MHEGLRLIIMGYVSVIIPNWNGKHHLPYCLDSLAVQTYSDFEVILVDNGSRDGSAAYVLENYPWVKLVELPGNIGFSGGNNRGLIECHGDYVVTLNNDTKVAPTFLTELVQVVRDDARVGMVAAKILNFHETDRIDSVGIRSTTAGIGVNHGVGETDKGQYDSLDGIFGPCAGAALYRRTMLEEVGFFDPDFFAYYEDLDLAWRGRLAGWLCVAAPGAVVYHVHSATGGRMSPFTVYHVHRNKWYVLLKNWPAPLLLQNLPGILAYDMASLLLASLKGRFTPALLARLHVVRDFLSLMAKRREITGLKKVCTTEIASFVASGGSPLKTFFRKMGSGI